MVFLNVQWFEVEVIVRLVNIGEIVDHHSLDFIFFSDIPSGMQVLYTATFPDIIN